MTGVNFNSELHGKEIPGSKGAERLDLINLLFKSEDEMKDLSPKSRKSAPPVCV